MLGAVNQWRRLICRPQPVGVDRLAANQMILDVATSGHAQIRLVGAVYVLAPKLDSVVAAVAPPGSAARRQHFGHLVTAV